MKSGSQTQNGPQTNGQVSPAKPVLREKRVNAAPAGYRCSLINLDNSHDDELDAILGELTVLESQFDQELIQKSSGFPQQMTPAPTPGSGSGDDSGLSSVVSPASDRSSTMTDLGIHSASHSRSSSGSDEAAMKQAASGLKKVSENGVNGGRTDSPDTDSAFCDNLSVMSSSSAASSNKTGQSGALVVGVPSTVQSLTREEQEARLKAEKIKIAIEKIKEASVKKLFIKVFTSDGSAKSLLVDEKMTVGNVTRILAEKNHVSLDPKWALVELVPDLYMERVYEDNEMLVENCLLWKVDSKNTLWFIERPEKFDLFIRPEIYLLGSSSSQRNDSMEEHCRQELVEEYFSSTGVGAPEMEGYIWLKSENKKSWKKFHFILRTSGLYYSPKGKKTSKDLLCLCTFDVNQVYYGVGWKRKFKAPTDFCFGIKHPQIQAKNPKYIRYLCVDSQKELHQWVTGIRMAKNGRNLHDNYRGLVEEITHADIDILMGKRGSTNSAMCLVGPAKAESCATNLNLNLQSPATSPISENKSFDSAVSSGIRSEHFLEKTAGSSSDLAKFDLRINENSGRSSASPGPAPLRRTSKSSSSLSDKSGQEQGFESDHPAGGTIKKRPPPGQSQTLSQGEAGEAREQGDNIRLGAGGTLLRRTNSSERLNSGKNYEELQQLLDELHTNVKQAKDIQAKLKSALPAEEGGQGDQGFPPPPGCPETPPPPPLRTSSRLSVDEADLLPPPPPELQSSAVFPGPSPAVSAAPYTTCTLPRKHLPPIAPKPNLSARGVPGSPKFKNSYGTLPNPVKKSAAANKSPVSINDPKYKSGRRISFDDNIQLIEDPGPGPSKPAVHQNPAFLQGLEKMVGQSHRLPPPHHHMMSPHHQPGPRPHPLPHCPNARPLQHCTAEPLYTAVVKPGSGIRPRHYAAPPSPLPPMRSPPVLPGSPGQATACCVGVRRCAGDRGDTSPEQTRLRGPGETGDYWAAESLAWPQSPRSQSEEKSVSCLAPHRPCDDIGPGPRHSSVPSSPAQSSGSRLWGSFRGKKPPTIDKRSLNPYLKTAS